MLNLVVLMLCLAAPPSDQEVARHAEDYAAWLDAAMRGEHEFSGEAMGAQADALFDAIGINELTAGQLATLTFRNGPTMRTTRRDDVKQRLADLANEPTPDGASAAMTLVMVTSYDEQPEILAAAGGALRHPALPAALADGRGSHMFSALGRYIDVDGAKAIADDLLALHDDLPATADPELLLALTDLVRMLANIVDDDQVEAYHQFRGEVLSRVNVAVVQDDDPQMAFASRFLDGAYARLTLFDHPLPACDVLWSSNGMSTLTAPGRVVVLEFFATWCTSCIAEFPAWRRVIERYEGFPVDVISVSELQGWHYPAAGERVDTRENPELEFTLMRSFIDERDVGWPVAIVPDGYLTEQLGERGIPTGFIVDARGVVRMETPNVRVRFEELCREIDELLVEAGLPAPPPLR